MIRVLIAACSATLVVAGAAADETTIVTNSVEGNNSATVIQTGPQDGVPVKIIRKKPGYLYLEQHDGSNSATIIQSTK